MLGTCSLALVAPSYFRVKLATAQHPANHIYGFHRNTTEIPPISPPKLYYLSTVLPVKRRLQRRGTPTRRSTRLKSGICTEVVAPVLERHVYHATTLRRYWLPDLPTSSRHKHEHPSAKGRKNWRYQRQIYGFTHFALGKPITAIEM